MSKFEIKTHMLKNDLPMKPKNQTGCRITQIYR